VAITDWQEIRGCGTQANYQGQVIRLGSMDWLEKAGVIVPTASGEGTGLARGSEWLATFAIRSQLKPKAAGVVKQLIDQGLHVYMVTGDRREIAQAMAREVGIVPENVLAEVLPENKAQVVRELQQKGEKVAFVGDGINDAPALAQADLGMAVMGAADLAREAADIILLRRDIEVVPEVLALSAATMRTIQQNFFWATGYNGMAVPLAMAGMLSPIFCAAAMGLSDLCVVGNSLRLFLWRPKSSVG
jgi:Cu+-exporting ATPase